jgi:hypothetical protein
MDTESSPLDASSETPDQPVRPGRLRLFWRRNRWRIGLALVILIGLGGYGLAVMIEEARTAARKSSAKCTLKGLGLAFHNYADWNERFPPHTLTGAEGTPLHGWGVLILPYVNAEDLYERIDLTKPWKHPDQVELFKTGVPGLTGCGREIERCPDEFPLISYSANSRLLRIDCGIAPSEITDGMTHTLLIGEITEARPAWGKPGNVRDPALGFKNGPATFGGPYAGVTQFVLADGSVRAISDKIDPKILKALATPDGDDEVGEY